MAVVDGTLVGGRMEGCIQYRVGGSSRWDIGGREDGGLYTVEIRWQ